MKDLREKDLDILDALKKSTEGLKLEEVHFMAELPNTIQNTHQRLRKLIDKGLVAKDRLTHKYHIHNASDDGQGLEPMNPDKKSVVVVRGDAANPELAGVGEVLSSSLPPKKKREKHEDI